MRLLILLLAVTCAAADLQTFEARKARVRSLLDQGDFAQALEQAKAINHDWADDIPTYQLMATAHLGLGNYQEAESAIQWMLDLRIGKTDAEGWRLVARFREVTGDVDGALEALHQAFSRVAPGQADLGRALLTYSCRLYLLAAKLTTADKCVKEAAARAPADPELIATTAKLRLAQGSRDEALRILRNLVKASPSPRYSYLLATVSGEPVDFTAFEASARRHISDFDNANRELVFYLTDKPAQAAEALRIAHLEYARRHDVFTSSALAAALFASGKTEEAKSVMNAVLEVGTRDPDILAVASRIGIKPE